MRYPVRRRPVCAVPHWVGPLVLIALLSAPLVARSAEPPNAAAAARLHDAAKEAYRAERNAEALELWKQALALDPSWKYAFNLAVVTSVAGMPEAAWNDLRTAERLGVPAEHVEAMATLRAQVGAALQPTHAYVDLEVDPPDAVVTRDGQPWETPRGLFVATTSSRIIVERLGYVSVETTLLHPVGARTTQRIQLKPLPVDGTLELMGTPPEAAVSIDGVLVAALGESPTVSVLAGRDHVVTIEAAGYVSERRRVHLKAGQSLPLHVALLPSSAAGGLASSLETPGWATLGSGLALLALGGGLLGWSELIVSDANGLADDPAALAELGLEGYRREFIDRLRHFDGARIAGWSFVGIGAAAAAAGAGLLVYDALNRPSTSVNVGLVPTRDGWLGAVGVVF